jgi:hypothetical protein
LLVSAVVPALATHESVPLPVVTRIVYLTDAKIEKGVKLLDVFPQDTYPPIRYPIAMTAGAGPEASRFVKFVTGKRSAAILASPLSTTACTPGSCDFGLRRPGDTASRSPALIGSTSSMVPGS